MTRDYRHPSPGLLAATQRRVATLLVQLQTDSSSREDCFNLALDAVKSCGDGIAVRLMAMENLALRSAANAAIDAGIYDDKPQALVDFCKGQHRLALVAEEADSKVAGMQLTDPIEVHLGYITKLAESPALPVQISTMLYPACAKVTDEDIAAVRKKLSNAGLSAQEAAANDQAFLAAMADSPLMRKLLLRLQPYEMQTVTTQCITLIKDAQTRLHARMESLDPDAANFPQQSRQLMAAFHAVETDIPLGATLPVLQSFLLNRGIASGMNDAA